MRRLFRFLARGRPRAVLVIDPKTRPLWRRVAETGEGNRTLIEARNLSMRPEYSHLTDGQLIRLAYWGATGEAE